MQPAAAQGLGRSRRVPPIALHYAIALGYDLADIAGRQLAVVIVDDFDEDAGARHTARAEPLTPARMRLVGVHTLIEPGDCHRRLALAVELVEAGAEDPE